MNSYTLQMKESFEVSRTKEDCFRYITDFSIIKEWDHTVISSKKTSDGKIQQGSLFDIVLSFGIRKTPMQYKITEFDFPNHAVLVGEADGFTAIDKVNVKSVGENRCHVTWEADVTFKGMSAKFIPKVEGLVKNSGKKTIDGLKAALEDNFASPSYKVNFKIADTLVFPGMFLFTKFGYNIAKKHFNPISNSMVGKHIVLTGCTSGIGLSAAKNLAHRGANLILVARNKTKAEAIKKDLTQTTGYLNIEIEIADMSLLKDVDDLANRIITKGRKVDVLINNAGALFNERKLTAEGIERSLALLLIAPHLLTKKLFPLLKQSKDARVINVSSGGMYSQKIKVNDLEFEKGKYNGSVAYARAKRGLMIMTEELAKKNSDSNIVFNAMHPGWADTPGVEDSLPSFYKLTKNILRTPEEGADTIVWMACATEASKLNGQFLLDRMPHKTHLLPNTKATKEERQQLKLALEKYLERVKSSAVSNETS